MGGLVPVARVGTLQLAQLAAPSLIGRVARAGHAGVGHLTVKQQKWMMRIPQLLKLHQRNKNTTLIHRACHSFFISHFSPLTFVRLQLLCQTAARTISALPCCPL